MAKNKVQIILAKNTKIISVYKKLAIASLAKNHQWNKKQIIIELSLAIIYDFIKGILHFGEEVKVLQPKRLINDIVKISKGVFGKYE